ELQQLRDNVTLLTNQCAQLDEANRAWQQYQQTQLDTFKNIFQHYLPIDETFTLNQAAQQILHQITKEREDFNERYQTLEKLNDDLRLESATNLETIKESYINTVDELNKELLCMKEQYEQTNKLESSSLIRHAFEDTPLKSSETIDQQEVEEIQQLRENLISLTAQLDETKETWQQYQQTQFDILRNQLQDCLSIDSNITFDEIAQQIVDQVTKEREDFTGKYQELEKQNDNLRSELTNNMESIRESYVNTVNELNQELLIMKKQCEQFDAENQLLTNELEKQSIQIHEEQIEPTIEKIPLNILKQPFEEVPIHTSSMNVEDEGKELEQLRERVAHLTTQCAQLDEANRAWQLYQEAQLENFRSKLHDCLSFDEDMSFDMIAQQIVEQISKEREDFNKKYQALEKANDVLCSESTSNLESIQQSYINTIDELNQELFVMKKQCEDLDAEKQVLSNELEKQYAKIDQAYPKQTIVSPDIWKQPLEEVPIHTSDAKIEEDRKELEQLRETVAFLTTQCTQLNEANDAWQQYQEAQLQNFRSKLHDYFSMDENTSLDIIAQQIVEQLSKEREDFNEKYQTLEKVNDILRSESTNNLESIQQDYTNTINELNQKLLVMNKHCEDLSTEKQFLTNELGKRSIEIDRDQAKPTIEKVSSNILRQPLEEVPIHTSDDNIEQDRKELEHLRETVAVLTTQCAQLDEANRAWQQYQQIQLDTFRNVFHQYLPIDESFTLNNATQQLFDQITKEKEDFNERYQALEKLNDDLRLESATNLETIKESYINAIDELNKELLSMKEQCEILIAEKQILTSELEKKPVELNIEQTEEIIGSAPINLLQEVPLQTSASNFDQENEELQQLRENFTILTFQYAQLNEANRAWQEFHQSQVDNFRKNIQDFIPLDDNLSFDHIAQKIMDEITKEREYSNERYQTLEKAHNDLQSESIQENKEFFLLKEQYDQILREKQLLINQIENQPIINKHERDTQTIESIDSNLLEQQTKMSQLQENLISLRTQLDETNHSWQEFEQTQSNLLQTLLPYSTKTSLEELIQEIILHINHLTKEIDLYKEKESQHDDNKIEDELTILQNQCTELDAANRAWQLFYDNQIDLLKDKLKDYINFNHNENFDQIIQLIVVQFEQQKQFNENISLDTTKDNVDLLKNQINNFQDNEQLLNQQILTLQQECQNLEQQLKENQLNIDSFKTNLQLTLNENEQLKQDYDELQQKNNLLINTNQDLENQLNEYEQQSSHIESQDTSKQMIQKEIRHTPIQEIQIHRLTPVQSRYSPNIDEELRQLRTDLTASSAHCLQLEEANRAWQQFHQNQLELFRQKLQNSIPLDENFTLEQIAQQVLIHLQQLENNNQLDTSSTIDSLNKQLTNYQLNELILSQNLEQLNQKLLDVYRECEEFRDHNAQLILSKQQIEQQIDELQLSNNNLEKFYDLQQHNESLRLENQQLQLKLNDMEQRLNQFSINSTIQRVDSTRENIGIHNIDRERDDEIHQLQTDLAVASNRCFELEAANSAWQKYQYEQIESLRKKLQEQIPSLNQIENSSLDFITQQILDYLHQLNIQRDNLLHQNDLLKDEIRLQKQQLERPRSVDSMQRMLQKRSHNKNITEPQVHSTTSSQSPSPLINEHEQELQQLRDNVTLLTNQ
ncbi:unnamed protein product, partial [Rotaria sordida]